MIQFSVLELEDLGFSQELLSPWSQSVLWNWVYKCTFEYYRKHEGNMILFKFIILPSCEIKKVKSKIVRKSSFDDMMFFWLQMIVYDHFSSFSVLCQRRYCCWNIESELDTWKIVTIVQRWYKSRKKFFNQSFWSSFVSSSLQWDAWLYYDCVRTLALKHCHYHNGHLLTFRKRL